MVGSVKLELQYGTVRGARVEALPCSEVSGEEAPAPSAPEAAKAAVDGPVAVANKARKASAHDTNRGTPHYRLLSKAKSHFPAVVQTVGFGPGRSKMLDLSMGVD